MSDPKAIYYDCNKLQPHGDKMWVGNNVQVRLLDIFSSPTLEIEEPNGGHSTRSSYRTLGEGQYPYIFIDKSEHQLHKFDSNKMEINNGIKHTLDYYLMLCDRQRHPVSRPIGDYDPTAEKPVVNPESETVHASAERKKPQRSDNDRNNNSYNSSSVKPVNNLFGVYYGCREFKYDSTINRWVSDDDYIIYIQNNYLEVRPSRYGNIIASIDRSGLQKHPYILIEEETNKVHFFDLDKKEMGIYGKRTPDDYRSQMWCVVATSDSGSFTFDAQTARGMFLFFNERIDISPTSQTTFGFEGSALLLDSFLPKQYYYSSINPLYLFYKRRFNKRGENNSNIALLVGYLDTISKDFGSMPILGGGFRLYLASKGPWHKEDFPFISATLLGEFGRLSGLDMAPKPINDKFEQIGHEQIWFTGLKLSLRPNKNFTLRGEGLFSGSIRASPMHEWIWGFSGGLTYIDWPFHLSADYFFIDQIGVRYFDQMIHRIQLFALGNIYRSESLAIGLGAEASYMFIEKADQTFWSEKELLERDYATQSIISERSLWDNNRTYGELQLKFFFPESVSLTFGGGLQRYKESYSELYSAPKENPFFSGLDKFEPYGRIVIEKTWGVPWL